MIRGWLTAPALMAGVLFLSLAQAQAGEPQDGDAPARRLITLAPHLAELVYAAGAGQALVGTVEYSDFPEAARRLPRVGDAFQLDRERILSLQPDMLLAWDGGTPVMVIERLRSDGFPVEVIGGATLDSIARALERIGRLAGTEATATARAREFRQELDDLRQRYGGRPVLRAFFQISARPLYTVTGRQIISQAMTLCGGRNVFAEAPGLVAQVSAESVLAADPQVILATAGGDDDALAWWREFGSMAAVRRGNLYLVDADLVSRPGPRLPAGIGQICERIETARERSD
jgi:iron complex transport system substrate-binding protein